MMPTRKKGKKVLKNNNIKGKKTLKKQKKKIEALASSSEALKLHCWAHPITLPTENANRPYIALILIFYLFGMAQLCSVYGFGVISVSDSLFYISLNIYTHTHTHTHTHICMYVCNIYQISFLFSLFLSPSLSLSLSLTHE